MTTPAASTTGRIHYGSLEEIERANASSLSTTGGTSSSGGGADIKFQDLNHGIEKHAIF